MDYHMGKSSNNLRSSGHVVGSSHMEASPKEICIHIHKVTCENTGLNGVAAMLVFLV